MYLLLSDISITKMAQISIHVFENAFFATTRGYSFTADNLHGVAMKLPE